METEKRIKTNIILLLVTATILFTDFVLRLGTTVWWDSVITVLLVAFNIHYLKINFKKLTKKEE